MPVAWLPLPCVTAGRAEFRELPLLPGAWLPLPCVTAGRAEGRELPLVPWAWLPLPCVTVGRADARDLSLVPWACLPLTCFTVPESSCGRAQGSQRFSGSRQRWSGSCEAVMPLPTFFPLSLMGVWQSL